MSTGQILVSSAIVATVGAVGLGYYLTREHAAAVVPHAAATPAPEPASPTQQPGDDPRLNQPLRAVGEERERQTPRIIEIGGEHIQLVYHLSLEDRPRSVADIDDGTSGGFVARLVAAAHSGNDDAARALSEALSFCKGAPRNHAQFNAAEVKLRSWFAETGGVVTPGEAPQPFDTRLKALEDGFHRCEGVTDGDYATAIDVLRESIDRGADRNRIPYARALIPSDPKEALAQYRALWEKGYVRGLEALGVNSLPHKIAYIAAMGHFDPATALQQLAALEARTSPSAFQEASKEAVKILKNPNCCRL